MVDVHSHILYGIDDGAKTIDESLNILKKAYSSGITDIVLTPHFIINSKYSCNNQDKVKLVNNIKEKLIDEGIDINLYLGNEVYLDSGISSLINTDISTINGSRYMLIEFPMNRESTIIDDVLYELNKKGIIPVIAHPERYIYYYKNYDFFYDLIDRGCLLQGNVGSLYGIYGIKAKRMIKGLLKRKMITMMGSDVHHESSDIYSKDIKKDLLKLLKDKDYVEDILINNARYVINNEE